MTDRLLPMSKGDARERQGPVGELTPRQVRLAAAIGKWIENNQKKPSHRKKTLSSPPAPR